MHQHSTLADDRPQRTWTWSELVRVEPRLVDLEFRTRVIPRRYRSWQRGESIKQSLRRLVGWEAEHALLRHSPAYNCVYSHLFAIWEGR